MSTSGDEEGRGGKRSGPPRRPASRVQTDTGIPLPPAPSAEPPKKPRPSRPPAQRVTLEFAGPPLALPGEAAAAPPPREPDSLVLDTSEFHLPAELAEEMGLDASAHDLDEGPSEWLEEGSDTALALELDDEGSVISSSGWSRLRADDDERPAERPRSVTPPPAARDDALSLVTQRSRPPSSPGRDLSVEMRERFALGDFSGALRAAELVLGKIADHGEARLVADRSREKLIQFHTARLASLEAARGGGASGGAPIGERVLRVIVPEHEVRWMGLDHRQGFVLSRIDGHTTIDELVDATGMSRLEVLRTLVELVEARAVALS